MKLYAVMIIGHSLIQRGNAMQVDLRQRLTIAVGYTQRQVERDAEHEFSREMLGCDDVYITAREITPDEIEEVYKLA